MQIEWFVGVDGGGSKTSFAVSTTDSIPAAALRRTGCSYQTLGIAGAVTLIADGVRECLANQGVHLEDCAGCCLGIPCYGENAESDRAMVAALQTALAPAPIYVVNDVEIGWAGSLECREGIHIVAGTGSIAFGRGRDQKTARCGGWIDFFGDEGSCYWVGREAMSLFSKQADGRVPRGALYTLVRRELALADDLHFMDVVMRDLAPYRERVAGFQRYALQAAQTGDKSVVALYTAAARELTLMVHAMKQKLVLPPGTVTVSYSGGLFQAEELILQPFRQEVEALGGVLQAPRRSAVEGALILAIEQFSGRNS